MTTTEQRFGGDGAHAPGAQHFREGHEEVNGENEKIAHEYNAITLANLCKTA